MKLNTCQFFVITRETKCLVKLRPTLYTFLSFTIDTHSPALPANEKEFGMPLFRSPRSATIVLLVATSILVFQCLPIVRAQNSTSSGAQKMIKPITYPPARKGDQ